MNFELLNWYLLTGVIINIIALLTGLIFILKKTVFKMSFRNHSIWCMEERIDDLERRIYDMRETNSTENNPD